MIGAQGEVQAIDWGVARNLPRGMVRQPLGDRGRGLDPHPTQPRERLARIRTPRPKDRVAPG
jgi:hypothetical protein